MKEKKLLIDWILNQPCPNKDYPKHPHLRRYTKRYRQKRLMARSLWIGSGTLMILFGSFPALVVSFALGTTFAAFCLLDETD